MSVRKSIRKFRPRSAKGTVEAFHKGRELDLRSHAGKFVTEIKSRLRDNLDQTAAALIEADVANSALLAKMYLAEALKKPSLIKSDGSLIRELDGYVKFSNLQRVSLCALKKFTDSNKPSDDRAPESLGDLIVDTDFEEEGTGEPQE